MNTEHTANPQALLRFKLFQGLRLKLRSHLTIALRSRGPAKFNASENSLMTPSWM